MQAKLMYCRQEFKDSGFWHAPQAKIFTSAYHQTSKHPTQSNGEKKNLPKAKTKMSLKQETSTTFKNMVHLPLNIHHSHVIGPIVRHFMDKRFGYCAIFKVEYTGHLVWFAHGLVWLRKTSGIQYT
jgi:hypothetical protein